MAPRKLCLVSISRKNMASLLSDLQACLGSDRVLTDATALAPLLLDNRGRWQGRALCAVFPSTTEEVSEIMRVACRHNALVFAQGGNTGNAAAATPVVNDTDVSRTVLLSTTRLRRIEKIDTVNDSVVVQAGVPVAAVRETAALQSVFCTQPCERRNGYRGRRSCDQRGRRTCSAIRQRQRPMSGT